MALVTERPASEVDDRDGGGSLDDLLGAAEDPLLAVDPVSFLRSLAIAGCSAAVRPLPLSFALARFGLGVVSTMASAASLVIGREVHPVAVPDRDDRRFSDSSYQDNPYFFTLAQLYLLHGHLVQETLDIAGLPAVQEQKARFAAELLEDALAPTNVLAGNPAALRKAVETRGLSVGKGLVNLLRDVRRNGGWPSQVDRSGFVVGENMGASAGQVVYRNELIEVIQYEPQGETVYEVPLLFCPPWINKFYIMDLAPKKSLIEWAVTHGHTCFAISYRNPDSSMRDLSFEDYLFQGPLQAIDVVRTVTGAPRVNTLSVCLGGTLTAIALAYNARVGDDSIQSATFLNTHTDFSHPGLLGVFTDEDTVAGLEKRMQKLGYLPARQMARTFDAVRANDLIFRYVVNNWLMGEQPPRFDLLAWNNDSTNMPAKMHSAYLRSCYLNNEFSQGKFCVLGEPVDPTRVSVDTYVLAAVDDHLVPWQSGFTTSRLFGGANRFVLSSAGHIAGIVNPPSPKSKHWTNESTTSDPDEWRSGATQHGGSWWEDWIRWVSDRAGERVSPPSMGSPEYPPLGAAPGTYVHIKA